MPLLRRRSLLSLAAGLPVLEAGRARAAIPDRPPLRAHGPFRFLFITDTHLQPELERRPAAATWRSAKARAIPADFAIQGGDHVFDALGVNAGACQRCCAISTSAPSTTWQLPVHDTIGNHDLLRRLHAGAAWQPTDPMYGKKYFEDNWGRLYYAFDHKGVHCRGAGLHRHHRRPHVRRPHRRRSSSPGSPATLQPFPPARR